MHTNQLINETSVYLLQHAHNPVNWFPWSDIALKKAKNENKPILVSIGYAACHWCHVMERESFENEETAALMNEYFINIKVDREERPDIDHIYMDAVQAMTGSGGWPLNVFLTPNAKPFFGGTYFPPKNAYGKISWNALLHSVHEAWTNKKNEIESQAQNLSAYLINTNSFIKKNESEKIFTKENAETITKNILQNADATWGGFGKAPKFPQTFCIRYLLRFAYFTKDEKAKNQALLSLDKMMQGGIYDHVGGGFSRYSTDAKWLAPHFEKMLYDNALLVMAFSEAYQLTQNENYKACIHETMHFIEREMLSKEHGFYSAIDADSESVEGKFYTWSKSEIENILKEDANLFCKIYDVSENGNWEHTNILRLLKPMKEIADDEKIDLKILVKKLEVLKQKLFAEREKRVRPQLDDKVLLGWNSLMITACCKAFAATGTKKFLSLAEKNIHFLEQNLKDNNSKEWFHTWKNGIAKQPAFLDDYAFLIEAYINLQEVTGNENYLLNAKEIAEFVLKKFSEKDAAFFSFTKISQQDILLHKKEIHDGATPSGNAVMAQNLYYLSIIFDKHEWNEMADEMLQTIKENVVKYPSSFAVWAMLLQNKVHGMNEIVVAGKNIFKALSDVNTSFIPNKIIQSTKKDNEDFPLLAGKWKENFDTLFYLCRNYECEKPVGTLADLLDLIKIN